MERSQLYGLLANVFRREPSVKFLHQLNTPELVLAFGRAGIDLGEEFKSENFEALAQDLAIEYTRLFLGPGKHISPHESVQKKRGSGILWGVETSAVRQVYHAAGFEIGEKETLIPDHISVELDFLSLLASQEAQAWHELDHVAEILRHQHDFVSQHLGKWVAAFCAKVRQEADFAFYPAFASLLRGYLAGEKAEIVKRLQLTDATAGQPQTGNRGDQHFQSADG